MPSFYDPRTRTVFVADGDGLYIAFHEQAHADQHRENCLAFRAWNSGRFWRGLCYFATIWVEWDAYRRSRRAMRRNKLWSPEIVKEARQALMSYVKKQEELK